VPTISGRAGSGGPRARSGAFAHPNKNPRTPYPAPRDRSRRVRVPRSSSSRRTVKPAVGGLIQFPAPAAGSRSSTTREASGSAYIRPATGRSSARRREIRVRRRGGSRRCASLRHTSSSTQRAGPNRARAPSIHDPVRPDFAHAIEQIQGTARPWPRGLARMRTLGPHGRNRRGITAAATNHCALDDRHFGMRGFLRQHFVSPRYLR